MNKAELVEELAAGTGLSKVDAKAALDCMLDAVKRTLKKGGSVVLTGFGTLSVVLRKGRTGMNPSTKKPMKIPAKKAVRFKAGRELKEIIN